MNTNPSVIPSEVLMVAIVLICTIVVFLLMKMQRLTKAALPLALLFALAANYCLDGLHNATIGEMAVRIGLSYLVIRIAGTLLGQLTADAPVKAMNYSAQQPVIEFEEVS